MAERKAEMLWRTVYVLMEVSLPVFNLLSLRESELSTSFPKSYLLYTPDGIESTGGTIETLVLTVRFLR